MPQHAPAQVQHNRRLQTNPTPLTAAGIMMLQRSRGNHQVERILLQRVVPLSMVVGKLKLDKMPTVRGAAELPEFVVKVALNHWYLRPDENDYPLVSEFSIGFDANSQKDADELEKFPPTVVAGANRLFRDVENQASWLAQFGSTKTAYVFEVMSPIRLDRSLRVRTKAEHP